MDSAPEDQSQPNPREITGEQASEHDRLKTPIGRR